MDETELINELLELTLACQQGLATPEERARLELLLDDHPSAINWYLRISDDTLTFCDAARSRAKPAQNEIGSAAPFACELPLPRRNAGSAPTRFWQTLSVCAAIAGLIVVGLVLRFDPSFSSHSRVRDGNDDLARVIEVTNVTWAQGAPKYEEWSSFRPGARLQFETGWVNLFFPNGAEVLIEGPADIRYESPQKIFATKGKLAARIGPDAVGFRIDTPHANVTDRGTEFGLSVDGASHTSVVVYKGEVDMDVVGDAARPSRRLQTGEALSVDRAGQLSRITTVEMNEFLEPPQTRRPGNRQSRLIGAVTDNVRSLETAKYYRVIGRGFRDDCQAYVDRLHEWNGLDRRGLPPFLVGGDYVMTFNDDKIASHIEIAVTLARPANLFVLLDDRVPPPEWLTRDFVNTKWKIGGDDGWTAGDIHVGVGPGQSIDQTFTIWHRVVREASTVVLGPLTDESGPKAVNVPRSMYGIVATALRSN
jgi:hypothetical protein